MRRFPWLTVVVAAVTAIGTVVEQSVPGTLGHLQRTPAALHGDWWRWLSALVVQDGHVVGGVFNIAGLLLCGAAAEQVVRRRTWLATYLAAGLVGQVFGQLWQPVGAGNSVAVCGLAALCVAVVYAVGPGVPPVVALAPLVWLGDLASSLWTPLIGVGIGLGIAAAGPLHAYAWVRYLVAGPCVLAGVVLLIHEDLHGGAFLVALIAVVPVALGHERLSRPASGQPG